MQEYLESMLNYYHKSETMPQYFTNNQQHFAWLCVFLMVMIFALVTSLAYCYYSGVGNQLWIYHIISAAAIIHAYANSMGSMNTDARLIELKFAAHAYDFYGRLPMQHCINNTTPIAQLNLKFNL
jgi:uncharacterized membrane protein YagU involved in acid resistance